MREPRGVIIDTNVLIVANGDSSPQASDECIEEAQEFLIEAEASKTILLDTLNDIFSEYSHECSFSGQPGIGDHFFLELHRRQADVRKVRKVEITPTADGSYEEVPASLKDFDLSDHKFIAVAVSDGFNSSIVNCVDSDWSHARDKLELEKISVNELCPDCLKKKAA